LGPTAGEGDGSVKDGVAEATSKKGPREKLFEDILDDSLTDGGRLSF